MKRLSPVVALLLVALVLSPASAEGWLWNPFAKKETKTTYPKWPPKTQMPSTKKAEPTTWQKMTSGPKKAFDWLNPFDGNSTTNKTTSTTAPKNAFISQSNKAIESKPNSVPEFLALPRPGKE